ncbi:50S ribosomal protein L9 [Candidatus Wolfebacteria bacterium RIFCSPLOWO2_01_FULL_45_19]|uniref:Large ribosomal subunit protein bL9 n=1 Tax=Candidatus Wolfebacteria bacterium RIFCSPLOWO2_01_FULL_45_19 TaxID=1802557 RepID=A0A1F8DSN4_9BACT|nr:MAG: 50S ribosomal protein L9 [Candidatus Wolfebacteria bacterium RIFCSPLOWO2_01_FULL_45_19]
MRVILLQDIKGLGRRNDVKDASDGYARNFLILKGLAKAATDAEIKKLNEEKSRRKENENALIIKLREFASQLSAESLEIRVSAGEMGELFAAVSGDKILEELRKKYLEQADLLEKTKIKLENPIKAVGEYKAEIDLGFGVITELNTQVSKTH